MRILSISNTWQHCLLPPTPPPRPRPQIVDGATYFGLQSDSRTQGLRHLGRKLRCDDWAKILWPCKLIFFCKQSNLFYFIRGKAARARRERERKKIDLPPTVFGCRKRSCMQFPFLFIHPFVSFHTRQRHTFFFVYEKYSRPPLYCM